MVMMPLRPSIVPEMAVMLFQVVGVIALCLSRFASRRTNWANRGRAGVVLALVGLGLAGAFCGRYDSQFSLFAGLTMTLLLIGITVGGGAIEPTVAIPPVGHEPNPLTARTA